MKIKFKLSLLVIAIIAVVVAGIASLSLYQASNISRDLSIRSATNLAAQQAEYWKGREDSYIRMLRTLANIMADYEDMSPDIRRDRFDSMLRGTITSEPSVINLYTVWKPNAVDGMDAAYRDRVGSTETGQYAIAYTMETGALTARATTDVAASMAYINGPNAKQDRIEQPFYRKLVNGKETYLVRIMVPIISSVSNQTVGGVGILLDIGAIQEAVQEVIRTTSDIASLAIYSSNGFILGNLRPENVGQMMTEAETVYGNYLDEASNAVAEGAHFAASSYSYVLNTNVEIIMYPFRLGNSSMTWTVMVALTDSTIMAPVKQLSSFILLIALISVAAAAIITYFVLHYTTKPIVTVTENLKEIAQGEGDLTRTISIKAKDETGELAHYFNQTLEKIKNLVIIIKQQSLTLFDIGTELASNMTETAAAVNEITANIQSIKVRVINQSAGVTETNATMEQITENITKLNGHVEKQTLSVSQSSSAIEEMLANIQSVTQTLVKNADNVQTLSGASEVGRSGLQEVAVDIQEIAKESEGLLEINSVMENIASQTNLLSMNAAIEAAHAGDAGKGFAVVADEIRKLAESSGEQSKTISNVLKKIKSSIDKITVSTDNVLARFEAIDGGVRTVSDQEENIRNAMEEQGEGSQLILEAIGQVNDVTQLVKGSTMEMLEGSKEVIRESKNLERVTQEIAGGMNEMASGSDQINIAIHRVNELTSQNRENIDMLMKEVARFKVE
ncbi:MAG: methyl-accepting chemotaxis protein [Spirochaetaceae bacterium]|jgi:methyl-accepting chemotaxis protein|nr:methyl-accepting chemotaxis protein [Spirochaetaceae bacterium]